jgi:hypothetical protein
MHRVLGEAKMFLFYHSTWLSLEDTDAPGLRNFGGSIHGILKTTVALGLYIIVAGSVISGGLSAGYSLIANSYGWKLSMVMLVGWPVSLGYALLWCSVMTICMCASLLQLVRWQEGADSKGQLFNIDFDALAEMLNTTPNPVLKNAEYLSDKSGAVDSPTKDIERIEVPSRDDSFIHKDEESIYEDYLRPSQAAARVEAPGAEIAHKPVMPIHDSDRETNAQKKSFFEISLDDIKLAHSFFVYKTETVKHEGLEVNSAIIAKSVLVLLANVVVSIFLNAMYSIVFFSNLDAQKKLLFQFAFAAVSTAWTKGGVGYSIKRINSSFRLQVLLNITMNVINTIVVPCLTMLVTSDYCFYGLFRDLVISMWS